MHTHTSRDTQTTEAQEAPGPVDGGPAPCKHAPTHAWKQIPYFTSGHRVVSDSGSSAARTDGNLLVIQEMNISSWYFAPNKDQPWSNGEFKASSTHNQ